MYISLDGGDNMIRILLFLSFHSSGEAYTLLEPTADMVRLDHCVSVLVEGLVSQVHLSLFANIASQVLQRKGIHSP